MPARVVLLAGGGVDFQPGVIYRWLQDESYAPPLTFLCRPDGTATADLAEMNGLAQDAWRPTNRKYAADPEPDPMAFLRRYGQHVRRVRMIASRLDGPCQRKGLSRMKPSARVEPGRPPLCSWLGWQTSCGKWSAREGGRPTWARATLSSSPRKTRRDP